ncbi:MAG: MFS transporter [Armatimonadota bacterium]
MGYHRRNLYILSTTIFLAAISWNQVIPFLSLFLQQLGVKEGQLMFWIYGVFIVQSISGMVAQPFWGKLGDRYGQKPMIIRAGICLTGIYFGMSICDAPWQLAMLRFLNGALTGFIPGSVALIATNTPSSEAPRAVATAQTASAAGQIVGPAVGGLLAAAVGYRGSMQVSGAAVLVSTILVAILVKEANKAQVSDKTSLREDFMASLQSPVLASIMLTVLLAGVYGSAINPVLAVHLANINGPQTSDLLIGIVFSLPPAAFLLTARAWTIRGERKGFGHTIQIGLIGTSVCAFMLTFIHNIWVFSVLFFAAGVFLAAIGPSTAALIAIKIKSSFHGRAYGIQNSAATMGALIAFVASSLIGGKYGVPPIFIFISVCLFVGSITFPILARRWGTLSYDVDSPECPD